jgi:hypothetical protein
MKKLTYLLSVIVAGIALSIIVAASGTKTPSPAEVKGSWKVVKAQYGNDPMKTYGESDRSIIKTFSGSRWSCAYFDKTKKVFEGAGGGTYKLSGISYVETIEYYSWDPASVGTTATFTLEMENGMLHQYGTFVYKDNPKYIIDEWYKRID